MKKKQKSAEEALIAKTILTLSDDQWMEQYKPVVNHFPDRNGAFNDTAFETYGEEEQYVKDYAIKHPNHVWTWLSGDSERIASGLHHVNRMGYFITEMPFTQETEVIIEDLTDYTAEHEIFERRKAWLTEFIGRWNVAATDNDRDSIFDTLSDELNAWYDEEGITGQPSADECLADLTEENDSLMDHTADDEHEKGAAGIIVTLEDGRITVTHSEVGSILFEKDAKIGDWDKIWDAIKA